MKVQMIVLYIVCIILYVSASWSQNSVITWQSFSSGFSSDSGANMAVISSAGQVMVGSSVLAADEIDSGFLTDSLIRGSVMSLEAENNYIPLQFALYQNYPNPFNPTTTIRFSIPKHERVTIDIYNILGQHILKLLNKTLHAGVHEITFDGNRAASGIYFYSIRVADFYAIRKMVLLK